MSDLWVEEIRYRIAEADRALGEGWSDVHGDERATTTANGADADEDAGTRLLLALFGPPSASALMDGTDDEVES